MGQLGHLTTTYKIELLAKRSFWGQSAYHINDLRRYRPPTQVQQYNKQFVFCRPLGMMMYASYVCLHIVWPKIYIELSKQSSKLRCGICRRRFMNMVKKHVYIIERERKRSVLRLADNGQRASVMATLCDIICCRCCG